MNRSMRPIPAGEIVLRDDRIQRRWRVEIEAFQLAEHPVTEAQYAEVMERPAAHPDCPVVEVSWNEAVAFCNRLSDNERLKPAYFPDGDGMYWDAAADGYRLPTEAEWEYACRAGTTKPTYGALDEIAWYAANSGGRPQAVGGKKPNAWGLHDMLGNVWEWCWDVYDPEVYGSYRVFRGGGWADGPRGCLASNRRRSHPTFHIDDLGFRVARSG